MLRQQILPGIAIGRMADHQTPLKAVFQKPLLEGWVDRQLITNAEAAVAQVEILDRLRTAAAAPGDGRQLVSLWKSVGFKVSGLPEAEEYETGQAHSSEQGVTAGKLEALVDK